MKHKNEITAMNVCFLFWFGFFFKYKACVENRWAQVLLVIMRGQGETFICKLFDFLTQA